MVEKRPLPSTSCVPGPVASQSDGKKIKLEEQHAIAVETSKITTPISIGEGQTLPNTTTSTTTPQHANATSVSSQAPAIAISTTNVPLASSGIADKHKGSTSIPVQTSQLKPAVQTAPPTIRLPAAQATSPTKPTVAIPAVKPSILTAIAKPTGIDSATPRLSSSICAGNRPRNSSFSTSSSGESSGRKTEISSLSSGSSHSGPLNAPPAPVVSASTPEADSSSSSSTAQTALTTPATSAAHLGQKKLTPPPPLKSTKMIHLRKKYLSQLEYMHREFKKLERQLLGAKSTSKNLVESAGSKERREKLHSFIVHVEDTLKQIQVGCSLEDARDGSACSTGSTSKDASNAVNSSVSSTTSEITQDEEAVKKEFARSSALTKLTKEKEEEENVQKLEEHILANLLPVKERLTKQLAAQQGAARNPVGMPPRRGLQPPGATAQGRNLSTVGQKIQTSTGAPLNPQATGPIAGPTAHSQFGRPLKGGGSSLTQKLHGKTLGSQNRAQGDGVGSEDRPKQGNETSQVSTAKAKAATTPRKVVYAGMTPGSRQVRSGVSAAVGVHDMVIQNARHQIDKSGPASNSSTAPVPPPPPPPPVTDTVPATHPSPKVKLAPPQPSQPAATKPIATPRPVEVKSTSVPPPPPGLSMTVVPRSNTQSTRNPSETEEERKERLLRKKMRKAEKRRAEQERQRQIMLHHQKLQKEQQSSNSATRRVSKQVPGNLRAVASPRKGPRTVEYICALCNETYKSTCECNPWWSLSSHECSKCGKTQIPRLDISAPANAIEYHPALLAHAATDDSGKNSKNVVSVSSIPKHYSRPTHDIGTAKPGTIDLNASDGELSSSDSDESELEENMSPSAQAENEDFGKNYSGPKFTDYDASRLLVLMAHASTCPGRHKTKKAGDICSNMKFMMLHVRDCPGTTPSYDICPFPWCRKTKHLLYHLVSCESGEKCKICSPNGINSNLRSLHGLNKFREQKRKKLQVAACLVSNVNSTSKSSSGKGASSVQPSGTTNAKKNVQQRRVSRNNTMSSGARNNRGAKSTHLGKHPALLASQNGITKRSVLSVPSPIPTVGLSSIKPSNPLIPSSKVGQNGSRTQHQNPVIKQNYSISGSVPKSTVLSSGHKSSKMGVSAPVTQTLRGPANPLTTTYAPPKNSSPPNPLKGLPLEQSTIASSAVPKTNFPNLPAQVAPIENEQGNKNQQNGHDGIRSNNLTKIKVEATGIQ